MTERRSGNEAISAAEARAKSTRETNIDNAPALPVPVPGDTANVRFGPEIHHDCLALLPLVGIWRGGGRFGNDPFRPGIDNPHFGEQITFSHDGRPFLRYESLQWLIGDDGAVTEAAEREVGFLRPAADNVIEFSVVTADGLLELLYGSAISLTAFQFASDGVVRSATAPELTEASRLYGLTPDGQLAYVDERAIAGAEMTPHASAVLDRIAG